MVAKASDTSLRPRAERGGSNLVFKTGLLPRPAKGGTPRNDTEPQPPVWIEVDLEVIRRNFSQIRRYVPSHVKILTVVKANAYGHGFLPTSETLLKAGADFLGVASVVEAVALRRAGLAGKILVLGQLLPEEAPLVVEYDLTQAIGDLPCAEALSRAASLQEKEVSIHLKVDTGMGRYGVWHEEAVPLAKKIASLPGLKWEGLFTHLSMAGQNPQATQEQLVRYQKIVTGLEETGLPAGIRHVTNSVGLLKFPESHWDLVRTGLLVYGVSPLKEDQPLDLRPALTLKSRVRFLKMIQPGQRVSYGGTYQAEHPTVVATIPLGYAHGYTRALSDKAQILIRGARAPVIGRITMEDLMCDVTDIRGVAIGDEAVAIGRQGDEVVTAEELARHARTIPYEILVGLSPAIPRRYL